jgi:alkylation response protein AidB-like acyl-CoA dehydrogenase
MRDEINLDPLLSEEEQLIRTTAREFADGEIAPLAEEIDRTHDVPRSLLERLASVGFMSVLIPEEYGGSGLSNACLFLIQTELNRACASTGVTMSVHNSLASSPIIRFGTDPARKRYLPKMATAEWIGAYALSEPVSGSDAASLLTRAERRGDGYVLNGQKVFVTNGKIADLFVVFARTSKVEGSKAKGISAFILDRGTPGLTVGTPETKLGIRGSSTVQLFLENCRVPAENLLGVEGEGFRVALTTLDGGRIGIAAQAIGIARACLEASIRYARDRRQFGRPIAEFEGIQWKLAEMATDIEAATLLGLRAARLRDSGVPHSKEAAMAKLFAASMANRHASEAVQIHGGAGYIRDFPVERYFRDAKITEIYEGTSEIQRIVIARSVLGQRAPSKEGARAP